MNILDTPTQIWDDKGEEEYFPWSLWSVGRLFSKSHVSRLGELFRDGEFASFVDDEEWAKKYEPAYDDFSIWRSFHGGPLDAISKTLIRRTLTVDPQATFGQRLKSFASVRSKLVKESKMCLSQMQDIGGCRAVVEDCGKVYLVKRLYEAYSRRSVGHPIIKIRDYVEMPRSSGYRSIHLMLRYKATRKAHDDRNGLRIEIQIRSRLQHAWAMAVETVEYVNGQPLKRSIGDEDWLEFFRWIGSATAVIEGTPIVPDTIAPTEPVWSDFQPCQGIGDSTKSYSTSGRDKERYRSSSLQRE